MPVTPLQWSGVGANPCSLAASSSVAQHHFSCLNLTDVDLLYQICVCVF